MPAELIYLPQLQLMSGNIEEDCIKDLARMLEDSYDIGEQREAPNKMRWSGYKDTDLHGSDNSSNLAGRIYKGKQLTIDDTHQQFRKMKKVIIESANEYINAYKQYVPHQLPEKWNLHFHHVWSVYQFEGDYNPIHYHDSTYQSTLSGFIHMSVPEGVAGAWDQTAEPSATTRDIDGTTELVWDCNTPKSALDFRFPGNMFIMPEVGTYYMFPSWLNHAVYPYKGEGCRVSISWNIGVEWIWPND